MKTYRQSLADVYKITLKSSLGIFIIAVFFIFFFNGLAWAFTKNGLNYLVPLLSFFYLISIYIILPFLITLILIKVLIRYGGGAMLFSFILLAVQFLIIFLITASIMALFFNWQMVWQLLKGPTYVIINFS